jgi:hypothetical protein
MSASSQSVRASRQYMSASSQYMSASSQSVRASSQFVSASSQSVSPSSQSMSASSQSISASSKSVVLRRSATHPLKTLGPSSQFVFPSHSTAQLQNTASASSQSVIASRSTTQPMSSKAATTPRTKEILIIDVSLTFANRIFHEDLFNKQSLKFLQMKQDVEMQINIAYNINTPGFISVTITGFRPGSIVSEGRLYFANSSNNDVTLLEKTLSDYGTATGEFEVSEFDEAANDRDDDNDELDWWQIGVIIAGVVVFFLLLTVIVLCVSIYIINVSCLKTAPK